jgi:hypothetical protein
VFSLLHRLLIVSVAFILALSVAVATGARIPFFSVPFFLCMYPALVAATSLVTRFVPLKYVESSVFTTLFRK